MWGVLPLPGEGTLYYNKRGEEDEFRLNVFVDLVMGMKWHSNLAVCTFLGTGSVRV